jgi:hypothetical protein
MTEQPADTAPDDRTPGDPAGVHEAAAADHEALTSDRGRDGGPQDADAMAAADDLSVDADVAREYDDMLERGAAQKGEGRLP